MSKETEEDKPSVDTSAPAESPILQETVQVSKDSLKESRILNENLTLLSATIQTLVKSVEKTLLDSTKPVSSGGVKVGSSPSKSPYNKRNTVDVVEIAKEAQEDTERTRPKGFGEIISKWKEERAFNGETFKDKLQTLTTPSKWDIRPILGVDKGSGSIVDKMISSREARQESEKEKTRYVKNAVKFGGVDEDTAKTQFDQIAEAKKKTAAVNERITKAKAAGYAPSEEDLDARRKAVAEQIKVDPRKALYEPNIDKRSRDYHQDRLYVSPDKSVIAPVSLNSQQESLKPTLAPSSELNENQAESLSIFSSVGETLKASLETQKELLNVVKEYFKTSQDKTKEEADGKGKGEGEEGGGGSSVLETAKDAKDLLGKGKGGRLVQGAKKALPMLEKAGSFLGKNAGKIGAVAGVAAGAYEAYTGWGDANDQLKSGAITEDKADELKGEAVGGGVGGAAGAWGGAAAGAAIGSVVPILGTAVGGLIGGGLGYMAGSGLGKKVGGSLVDGYKSVKTWFGGDKEEPQAEAVPIKPDNTPTGLDRPAVTSTSENTPPTAISSGGDVALSGGHDNQFKYPDAVNTTPSTTANVSVSPQPVKPNEQKPPKKEEPSLSSRINSTAWNVVSGKYAMDAVKFTGNLGAKAGKALTENVGKLGSWFTDDKRSALEKTGDVLTAPIRALGSVGGMVKDSITDVMDGDKGKVDKMPPEASKISSIAPVKDVPQLGKYIDKTTSEVIASKEEVSKKNVESSFVNAPTTINNNTTNIGPPLPIRNPENSQSRYIGSRFAF